MKKVFTFLAVIFVSLTALGQINSPVTNDFFQKFQELEEKWQEKVYEEKDYKQAELLLKEMIVLTDNLTLSDEKLKKNYKVGIYYNLACTYSLSNKKKEAVTAFEKSVEFGFSQYQHAKTDGDLDNIRNEKRFVTLMNELKPLFYRLYILQNSGIYQQENTNSFPEFIYQSAENSNLQDVKRYFDLVSIAGNGDEISKIINLMFFVTEAIKHDGTNNWPLCEFDAIDLYNYHKVTGKGISCRQKAAVLNEMYLAMGFKSRFVICMPKDPNDTDCHVINCVYSETLKKWLWMDPSFGIYITDEDNNLLSISEVRERLISNKSLILNQEARRTKEVYLDYMAKNLYLFQCFNTSRFNTESRYREMDKDLRYIALIPVGYEGNHHLNDSFITHDPDYFWQHP